MKKRKIAIVYDWMDSWGGVERMLLVLGEIYPSADWYSSYVDFDKAEWVSKLAITNDQLRIRTSFIQKLPNFIRKNRILSLPFYPVAFETFNLSGYDLVISVTSSFAKSVITHPGTKHVCILLTPTRWLWGQEANYELRITNFQFLINSKIFRSIKTFFINQLKRWDLVASNRPDRIISISKTSADRCLKYYGRNSEIIYPPFDIDYWEVIKSQYSKMLKQVRHDNKINKKNIENVWNDIDEYYLVVSRLEPYKKIDLIIEAFNSLTNKKLVIVGAGTMKKKLKKLAGRNITFIENATDIDLSKLYSNAKALIMPQIEDFGYVALEAQFFGCPVISYNRGGATETVIPGKTGVLFKEQTVDSLINAVAEFERYKYNLEDNIKLFEKFSKINFVKNIKKII
ncbi:hypothetical protein COY14_02700 [Candidatus Roizmanbacteria bacterium CG_4_10_14_0_2_um_filter_36_9]|uniref:Glycosyl transferase family 1 domain-containing protein n=1 Tax=Candidatus Roizmanbacteria bacterium CG_4_10_14_0_2_um_filter_36_9 TaxID=1974823 RepID=A0A2M7U3Y9_9BACT|nr:MAG: hypothetical protein COY14_02700 [Candidatus Roizmanbacteria bacterium CG_4_10_14_0_2_um_filter_36_9]